MRGNGDGGETGRYDDLWGRTFLSTMVTANGQARPLVPGSRLRLTFQDGQVRAHAGCNHMAGAVALDDGRLEVGALTSTLMSCGADLDEQDAWLAGFLNAGPTWRLDGDDLMLGTGDTELRLTDRTIAEPDRPLRDTRWMVDSIIDNQSATSVPDGVEAYLTLLEGD